MDRRGREEVAMARALQVYETPEITVTFEPAVCRHTGICVRGLREVFDIRRKRWIAPEAASADMVHAQVARCPSGALKSYRPGEFVRPAKDGD
jgi:uncharacterized Fe-S cluster protein YjdI